MSSPANAPSPDRVTVLSGGVGGARFLQGLLRRIERSGRPTEVTVVANTADDIWLHGLKICPDLDTVMYTLGGGIDAERGWGRTDETWHAKEELAAYGVEPTWFGLGDRDLATHLVRTQMLDAGYPLSAVTEALCGHEFSASSISQINKTLDASLAAFAERRLSEAFPYLILDARYEKVREGGIIVSQAVLVAVAVDGDGRRQILGVDLANRESRSSWRDFLMGLKARGLAGVEFVVSDDHPGLKAAIREVLPEAAWQRCYVHFLRNALDYVPRKVDDDCLQELRWLYDRRELAEVRRDLATWLAKWQAKYPKLCAWVEDNIEETLTYYRLPLQHHKHMKSTNMLERLNQELKRRTHVVRIFPNAESCLRLVRALAIETHENWLEAPRYLNMEHLKEHKKEALRALAA